MSTRRGASPSATETDVARVVDVSQTTESLVLNDPVPNRGLVSDEARARVLREIDLTGSTLNPPARGLGGASFSIVGVRTYEAVSPPPSRSPSCSSRHTPASRCTRR